MPQPRKLDQPRSYCKLVFIMWHGSQMLAHSVVVRTRLRSSCPFARAGRGASQVVAGNVGAVICPASNCSFFALGLPGMRGNDCRIDPARRRRGDRHGLSHGPANDPPPAPWLRSHRISIRSTAGAALLHGLACGPSLGRIAFRPALPRQMSAGWHDQAGLGQQDGGSFLKDRSPCGGRSALFWRVFFSEFSAFQLAWRHVAFVWLGIALM